LLGAVTLGQDGEDCGARYGRSSSAQYLSVSAVRKRYVANYLLARD
jgi:hypothetical protein